MTQLEDTEVFILTCDNRPSYPEARRHLEAQDASTPITVIADEAPMSKAFNQMLWQGEKRPFFVQCDDDMLLQPRAVSVLRQAIEEQGPQCAILALWLWDPHVERPIVGVKIYRRAAIEQVGGWKDVQSCEVTQMDALKAAGWSIHVPWTQRLLGGPWDGPSESYDEKHLIVGQHDPMFTPEMAYERYRDLMMKQRRFHHAAWVEELPKLFHKRAGGPVDLAALAGCIAGCSASLEEGNVEKDFRQKPWLEEYKLVAKMLKLGDA
jgi:hypothetical protein